MVGIKLNVPKVIRNHRFSKSTFCHLYFFVYHFTEHVFEGSLRGIKYVFTNVFIILEEKLY